MTGVLEANAMSAT